MQQLAAFLPVLALPDVLHDLVFDYTLRTVALGAAVIGIVAGSLGSFAVLRRQSLVGDAMSHAALPGIGIAYLITERKDNVVLLTGAAIAGWIATLAVLGIVRQSRVKFDSALGLVLSVFFGFGLMVLTAIQRQPHASQAGLDKFLFGQAATLIQDEVRNMAIVGAISLAILLCFWKSFKLLSFDSDFAQTIGNPVRLLDVLLTTLIVVAIVLGLQAVGVVLMSAMIVAPAAAARQWTDRLGLMVMLSGLFGAAAGVAGTAISGLASGLSTGPVIVLCISGIAAFSLLFGGSRGIVWAWLRRWRNRQALGDALA